MKAAELGITWRERVIAFIRAVADRDGRKALTEVAGVSLRETAAVLRGERRPTDRTLERLAEAGADLVAEGAEHCRNRGNVRAV
jgi:hypothetical protein